MAAGVGRRAGDLRSGRADARRPPSPARRLGACTDCRRLWSDFRGGRISAPKKSMPVNGRLAPTAGTCMVMGTASTMACHRRDQWDWPCRHSASIPATARRTGCGSAEASGPPGGCPRRERRTEAERGDDAGGVPQCARRPPGDRRLDQRAHPSQPRRRAGSASGIRPRRGRRRSAARCRCCSTSSPPASTTWKHFHWGRRQCPRLGPRAGSTLLDLDARNVEGTLAERRAAAWTSTRATRRTCTGALLENPINAGGSDGGAARQTWRRAAPIIKQSAATPRLLQHHRPCRRLRFGRRHGGAGRLGPDLDGRLPDDVLVLRNAGPIGAPGMPEAGYPADPEEAGDARASRTWCACRTRA